VLYAYASRSKNRGFLQPLAYELHFSNPEIGPKSAGNVRLRLATDLIYIVSE